MDARRFTVAHVTHEAVEQIGGIGTVLEGLMTSPVYQQHIKRSILVGPTATHMATDPQRRLGDDGEVLYSSIDKIDKVGLSGKLRPVEWAFNVALVYGKRRFKAPGSDRVGEAEVLLIDVFRTNPDRLAVFKLRLWETFGIDSGKYEKAWDYEEYTRLAEPAYYALLALMGEQDMPCILFSHEFMGMPAVLQATLEGASHFRTVFYAHECAPARRLVEDHPGHDVMFYNVMAAARAKGLYAEQVFGSLDHMFRHALVSRTHMCDGMIAVGDYTRDELKFLDPRFDEKPIDLVYNGVPAHTVTMDQRTRSRRMLTSYLQSLLGYEPDVVLTHVTRPVISKGLWRDLRVCHELEPLLKAKGKKAALVILTSGGGVRRPQDIVQMEEHYGWPRHHRYGYPDLVGPEQDIWRDCEAFNQGHEAVQVILVNQFGWSRSRIGKRLDKDMDFASLRCGTDVEFGMATYEPFGISPLEPLACGAVCVISKVCGCHGFVQHVTDNKGSANVITADFTQLDGLPGDIDSLKNMNQSDRDRVESQVSRHIAGQIMERLPWTDAQRRALLDEGQRLSHRMGWDHVIESGLLPMLRRIREMNGNGNGNGKKATMAVPQT
jgi:glycosyltransferase involved in cell wall biosynthesis